jgi:hypothetical protein
LLHARRLRGLLAAGTLLAPALALPLVVGTTDAASADAARSTNVNGAVTDLVRPGIGNGPARARHLDGPSHMRRGYSRTWV